MDKFLSAALEAVKNAEKLILKYYSEEIRYTLKPDQSPVTLADKGAEEEIIRTIKKHFPNHDFIGEESFSDAKDNKYHWIIDPIDGTKNYLRKIPIFATQLALVKDGEIILGISNAPAMGELLYAQKGKGAFLNKKKISTSNVKDLNKAFLVYGSLKRIEKKEYLKKLLSLGDKTQGFRGFGDYYNYHLLATGAVDVVIEADCKIWDVAALKIIVEEAGGIFTDIKGKDIDLNSTSSLATNQYLHPSVLKLLK